MWSPGLEVNPNSRERVSFSTSQGDHEKAEDSQADTTPTTPGNGRPATCVPTLIDAPRIRKAGTGASLTKPAIEVAQAGP